MLYIKVCETYLMRDISVAPIMLDSYFKIVFLLVICSNFLSAINCFNLGDADQVISLPGLETKPSFKHYSGYLNASNGRHLHYWFVESGSNPVKDPVILWLNGGPGCSSITGMFTELGPWRINEDLKTLRADKYSWNTLANVIFLESPAGVGFSYQDQNNLKTDDEQTAHDNHLALQHFFSKFPQFKKNNFYLSGQSYAGVYVPMLARNILAGNSDVNLNINLKGFAIGNGYYNKMMIGHSKIEFAYDHALLSNDLWNKAVDNCCQNNTYKCNFVIASSKFPTCKQTLLEIANALDWFRTAINPYNILKECHYGKVNKKSTTQSMIDRQILYEDFGFTNEDATISANTSPCSNSDFAVYFNDPKVRKAIHIKEGLPEWGPCNREVSANYTKQMDDMKPIFNSLIHHNKLDPIIIYNGDIDMVCSFIGNRDFIDTLQLPVLENYHKWIVNNQTAGFVKRYNGLSFVTVKGAGHGVPEDKPQQMLKILNELIGKSKLS